MTFAADHDGYGSCRNGKFNPRYNIAQFSSELGNLRALSINRSSSE
jgi:hypothetical protein